MLILVNTTDKLQVVTSSAAAIDVHASFADLNPVPVTSSSLVTPGKQNTAITSATTTDIVAAPAASTTRNVKSVNICNKDASLSCDVTVNYNQNATIIQQCKFTLRPGDVLEFVEGIGWFPIASNVYPLKNYSTASVASSYASDIYLVGSSIAIPANMPVAGTVYRCEFDLTKTAAGIAALAVTVRIGTNGSTADTSRLAFSFVAGTAAADTGKFWITAHFRSVGSGTSAVLVGTIALDSNLTTTGLTASSKALAVVSSGFDSTVANSIIGVSVNGGASFVGSNTQVFATLGN